MSTEKLQKAAWQPYFDHVSKTLHGKLAEIEVNSLTLGSQIQADWVPLMGITYDKKDDMIEVFLEGMDHMIRHPRDVYLEQNGLGLTSLEIVDTDNVSQIIKLRDPLMLPSP
jgi:hypothetical protein